jgi:hypothetical protein
VQHNGAALTSGWLTFATGNSKGKSTKDISSKTDGDIYTKNNEQSFHIKLLGFLI